MSNETTNPAAAFDAASNGPIENAALSICFIIYTCVLSAFIVASNVVVVYLINGYPPLLIPPNVLLASLAVADAVIGLLNMPLGIYYTNAAKWIFGETLCKVGEQLQ